MSFITPVLNANKFTCPYCNVLAQQNWDEIGLYSRAKTEHHFGYQSTSDSRITSMSVSTCVSCGNYHFWYNGKMIIPAITSIPLPAQDMPESVTELYNEAKEIVNKSPRAAAALLRLSLQYLCIELGERGENINQDIKELVKKGLDVRVQKALDIVRVSGNNAVHPGVMDLNDEPEICHRLFGLLNYIVETMITQPKLIDSFFDELPETAKESIERRDDKK